MSKRDHNQSVDDFMREILQDLNGNHLDDNQVKYNEIAAALEQIILLSNNARFREKCFRLLLGDGGRADNLRNAILTRLHQQTFNRMR